MGATRPRYSTTRTASASGVPNSFILINDANDAIAIDDACEIKPTWNAAVCRGDVGRMTVSAPAGGRGGRGAGGGRGGAPAAAGPAGRGGAAVAGGPGAGRGGAGGLVGPRNGVLGAAAPAGPPIVLSRNGKDFPVTGETNVRAGTEIKVTTERPSLSLSVKEPDSGLVGDLRASLTTTAVSGAEQSSPRMPPRKASATSYYKDNGALWVKLVSSGDVLGSGPGSGPSGGASLRRRGASLVPARRNPTV